MNDQQQPLRGQRADDSDPFDYRAIRFWLVLALRAPFRHKWLAAGCFSGLLALAVLALVFLPRTWEVRATMLAQPNPLSLEFNQNDVPTRAAQEIILRRENVIGILKSTDFVARHEAGRTGLAKLKAKLTAALTGRDRSAQQALEDYADALAERLWVNVTPASGTVEIGFRWSNKELAYDVVDAAIESFLESRHGSEIASVAEQIAILEDHAARVNREITVATKSVEALEKELKAGQGPRRAGVAAPRRIVRDEESAKLASRLAAKRRSLAEVEEFRQRRLAELQAQLEQQETMYATQHPAVVATRRSIEAMSVRSPQVDSLREEVSELEQEATRRGQSVSPLTQDQQAPITTPEADFNPTLDDPRLDYARHGLWLLVRQHSALLERIDSARVKMDTAKAGFKYRYSVVTPPQIPKHPVSPKPLMLLAMGLLGGLFMAVFAAVAADLWSGVIIERWQVESDLGLPVLAQLPDRF